MKEEAEILWRLGFNVAAGAPEYPELDRILICHWGREKDG